MSRLPMPLPGRAVLVLALASALAGCSHTIRVAGARHLRVALTEYRLTPDTVRAYAGTLTITVRNVGTRTHDLVVTLGSQNAAQTPELMPGASTTMTVALAPGKYLLRSTIPGDQALGLSGTLDVVATRKT